MRVSENRPGWGGSELTKPPFHSWPRSQGPAHLLPLPPGSVLLLTGSLRLVPAVLGLEGGGVGCVGRGPSTTDVFFRNRLLLV